MKMFLRIHGNNSDFYPYLLRTDLMKIITLRKVNIISRGKES